MGLGAGGPESLTWKLNPPPWKEPQIRGKGTVAPQRERASTTAVSMEMVSHSLGNSDFETFRIYEMSTRDTWLWRRGPISIAALRTLRSASLCTIVAPQGGSRGGEGLPFREPSPGLELHQPSEVI